MNKIKYIRYKKLMIITSCIIIDKYNNSYIKKNFLTK